MQGVGSRPHLTERAPLSHCLCYTAADQVNIEEHAARLAEIAQLREELEAMKVGNQVGGTESDVVPPQSRLGGRIRRCAGAVQTPRTFSWPLVACCLYADILAASASCSAFPWEISFCWVCYVVLSRSCRSSHHLQPTCVGLTAVLWCVVVHLLLHGAREMRPSSTTKEADFGL